MKQIDPGQTGVAALRGVDPAKYRREGIELQVGFNALSKTADAATEFFQTKERRKADTNASLRFSEKYNELSEKPYLTTSEVLEQGVQDRPDLWRKDDSGEMVERDDIASWEVAPEVSKFWYDKIVSEEAEGISGPGHRDKWLQQKALAGQRFYDQQLQDQREAAWQADINDSKESIERAVNIGDYALAQSLAETHPVMEERDKLVDSIQRQAETDSYNRAIQTQDPEVMLEQAEFLKDPDYAGKLNEDQQTAWINQLENFAARHTASAATGRAIEYDRKLAWIENGIAEGSMGMADLNEFQETMYREGWENYVGKSWYSNKIQEIKKVQAELLRKEEARANVAFAMTGQGIVNPNDSYQVDAVDDMATKIVMDPTRQDAVGDLVRLSKSSNIMPEVVQNIFRTVSNPMVSPEDATFALETYEKFMSEVHNEALINQIPDESMVFLEMMSNFTSAGMATADSIAAVRNQMDSQSADELRRKTRIAKDHVSSGELTKNFESMIKKDSKYSSFWQRWGMGADTIASHGMAIDFENQFQYFLTLGANVEAAEQAAYKKVSAVYGISEINGRKEIMRNGPEASLGMDTDQVKEMFHNDMTRLYEVDDASNLVIKPHATTEFEGLPTYQVYSQDEFGQLHLETDENLKSVVWTPDVDVYNKAQEKIAAQKKIQDDKRAAKDREIRLGGPEYPMTGAGSAEEEDLIRHLGVD